MAALAVTQPDTPAPLTPLDDSVHQQGMRIDPETASKLWARIEIDEAAFREHNKHRVSLRVRGFRPPQGLIWQFDGQTYPLESETHSEALLPGERIWVPLIVAQFGVRANSHWPYKADPAGQVLNEYDFLGAQIPMIRIIEIRDPGDFSKQMEMPKPAGTTCSYCGQEVDPAELGKHMQAEHLSQMVAELDAAKAAAAPSAQQKVKDWASKQARKEEEQATT